MITLNAVVLAAQDVEVQPFLDILDGALDPTSGEMPALYNTATRIQDLAAPTGRAWLVTTISGRILVLRTGIGLVATASALGWVFSEYNPRCVISIGAAGGLTSKTKVLELVAGNSYMYGSADATAFGYQRGQVPGQPVSYPGGADLLINLPEKVHVGPMLSSDSFITEANIGDTREAFPEALSTDMESAAAAQTCTAWGIPFVSIRSISDLCGAAAGEDYHASIEAAALASATAATSLLESYQSNRSHGRSPLFGRPAIDGALLLLLARNYNMKPSDDTTNVPDDIANSVRQQLTAHPSFVNEAIGLVSSAITAIKNDPSITLTAKRYDTERAKLVSLFGISSERGQIAWPPTSQTVSKRSNGYWNDALAHLGIQVKTGRQRGAVKFSHEDYVQAMTTFVAWSQERRMSASVAAYNLWLKQTDGYGSAPSSAAVRQHFGTWRAAVNATQE